MINKRERKNHGYTSVYASYEYAIMGRKKESVLKIYIYVYRKKKREKDDENIASFFQHQVHALNNV